MQNDHMERLDLHRMADDGCPNTATTDSLNHDVTDFWAILGNNDQAGG
jgi:hypothetical protein